MIELVEANWLAFLLAAVLAILVALWLITRGRRETPREKRPDVLDEGAPRAQRNQALIDAPPAAQQPSGGHHPPPHVPPATPDGLAGAETAVAAAVLAGEPGVNEDVATDHHPEMAMPRTGARPADAENAPPARARGSSGPPAAAAQDERSAAGSAAAAVGPTPETTDASAVAAATKIAQADGPADAADDLSRIKGVGPKLLAMLGTMGISRYDQIAAWNDEDVQRIDAELGNFRGRIVRDNWVEQCRYLAAGDVAGYEEKFGKL